VAGVTADTDVNEFANNELDGAIDKDDVTVGDDDRSHKKSSGFRVSVSLIAALMWILF